MAIKATKTMTNRKTGKKTTTTTSLRPVTKSEFNGSGRMSKTMTPLKKTASGGPVKATRKNEFR